MNDSQESKRVDDVDRASAKDNNVLPGRSVPVIMASAKVSNVLPLVVLPDNKPEWLLLSVRFIFTALDEGFSTGSSED